MKARFLRTVTTIVKGLTRELAEFFGLDVGSLDIGAQADTARCLNRSFSAGGGSIPLPADR